MATRGMDFLLRVHVNAEEGTDPRWIKRQLTRALAGDRRGDGFAVYGAEGSLDVTRANGSGVWGVADAALKQLESWTSSEYQGSPEYATRMAELETLRHRLGPKPL